jgi:hypothetical protein
MNVKEGLLGRSRRVEETRESDGEEMRSKYTVYMYENIIRKSIILYKNIWK